MTAEEEIIYGHQAAQALEFIEPILNRMRDGMVNKLIDVPASKSEEVLALHIKLQGIAALADELRQAVFNGETAAIIAENE